MAMPIHLDVARVPEFYKCSKCGATGCKLWMEYPVFHGLLCAECSAQSQEKSIEGINAQGMLPSGIGVSPTNTIGSYTPAYPVGVDVYGFSEEAKDWWERLPTLPIREVIPQ